MSAHPIQHIAIIGGGTAGWMTANLLAQRWRSLCIKISLIESADIGIIGVGEGSTPFLRQFFHQLDIPESEWMPACNATYKCGIRFPNWSSVLGYEEYVHPFFNQQDIVIGNEFFTNACLRRGGVDADANPQDFFLLLNWHGKKKLRCIYHGQRIFRHQRPIMPIILMPVCLGNS